MAIKEDVSLDEIFQRIAKKSGKKRAIVGIARRLVGRIRSCVSAGTLYQIMPIQGVNSSQELVA